MKDRFWPIPLKNSSFWRRRFRRRPRVRSNIGDTQARTQSKRRDGGRESIVATPSAPRVLRTPAVLRIIDRHPERGFINRIAPITAGLPAAGPERLGRSHFRNPSGRFRLQADKEVRRRASIRLHGGSLRRSTSSRNQTRGALCAVRCNAAERRTPTGFAMKTELSPSRRFSRC